MARLRWLRLMSFERKLHLRLPLAGLLSCALERNSIELSDCPYSTIHVDFKNEGCWSGQYLFQP